MPLRHDKCQRTEGETTKSAWVAVEWSSQYSIAEGQHLHWEQSTVLAKVVAYSKPMED